VFLRRTPVVLIILVVLFAICVTATVVHFPDPGLEAAIRDAIDKPTGDILQSDLVWLKTLAAGNRSISDLTGIESCVNLTRLELNGSQISDLTPLAGLTNLGRLELIGNQISDLTPLAGLTNLGTLYLNGNQISDLTPLAGLTNLGNLYLIGNQISDLTPFVNNAGIGSGVRVDMRYNYLCCGPGAEDQADLQALIDRGIILSTIPQECRPDMRKDTPGDVYSFGGNSEGQLGHGDTTERWCPTKIAGLSNAVAVAAGLEHSLVVLENGDVYSFGDNSEGQLGHGDRTDRWSPTKIAGLSNAVAVAAGFYYSLVLLENGDVYSFGENWFGQLGHGDTTERRSPTKIAGLSNAVAVAAGFYYSLVLLENGDVYSFGENYEGQLGHGDTTDRWSPTKIAGLSNAVAVAGGGQHSLVSLENGDVYSFGENYDGQLGHGDTTDRWSPTKIAGLSNAVAMAGGGRHSLVSLENGDVYSFGDNMYGRLGHGNKTDQWSPTKIWGLFNAVAVAGGEYSLVFIGTTPQPPAVSTPTTPSGPSTGTTGTSYSYSTGGSTCNQGHAVQYRFDWGDGTTSNWSSSTSASKSWSSAGTYPVRAQARCATNTLIESGWSSAKSVTISEIVDSPAVFRVDADGNVLADGTVSSPALGSGSADVAEWVLVSEEVEPGDVLEHDPANLMMYRKSSGLCSELVAGVVSTQPGLVLGTDILQLSPEALGTPDAVHALLALVGIVPVKVTDEGGPINPGDLLVASSTPGYAMRWDPSSGEEACGVIGKALEGLEFGEGIVKALLMR
jgi:hypothetical protein